MKPNRYLALFAVAMAVLSGFANAEIYKYTDPVTGVVRYTSSPPQQKGVVLLSSGETLNDVMGSVPSYRCPGNATGEWSIKSQPVLGCYRIGPADRLLATELDIRKELAEIELGASIRKAGEAVDTAVASLAALRANVAKRRAQEAATINKIYPNTCHFLDDEWTCLPRVGMRIDRHKELLGLELIGYVEDEKGKLDRWSSNGCLVMARGVAIVSVRC